MSGSEPPDQRPGDVPPIADWGRLLDSKVAVVTGGGAGIGGAISRIFASTRSEVCGATRATRSTPR